MAATGDDGPSASITPSAAIRPPGPRKGGQRFRPRVQQPRPRSGQTGGRLSYSEVLKKWTEPTPAHPKRLRKKGVWTRRAIRRRGPL